jgi:hypothetical protein
METARMPHYQRMHEENVVLILSGILFSHKENEILPFASK